MGIVAIALIGWRGCADQLEGDFNPVRQPVKAESVTINMPEGMTKDQADAILNELKAIHQLLLHQQ